MSLDKARKTKEETKIGLRDFREAIVTCSTSFLLIMGLGKSLIFSLYGSPPKGGYPIIHFPVGLLCLTCVE